MFQVELLETDLPPPADVRIRATVEQLRKRLIDAHAVLQSGNVSEALKLTRAIATESRRAGYPIVRAEALLGLAKVLVASNRLGETGDLLAEATYTAVRYGAQDTAIKAASMLMLVTGAHFTRWEEARTWYRTAKSMLTRSGGDADIRAQMSFDWAAVEGAASQYGRATRNFDV